MKVRNQMQITLNSVTALEESSYYIVCGYNNKSDKVIYVDYKECNILVTQSGILLLSNHPPIYFEKRKYPKVMKMIALFGSEIEWAVKEEEAKSRD